MQAIRTRIIPGTNTRAARIKAECSRGSIIIQCALVESHNDVVDRLVWKFLLEDEKQGIPRIGNPWYRNFVTGQLKDGSQVHVFVQ